MENRIILSGKDEKWQIAIHWDTDVEKSVKAEIIEIANSVVKLWDSSRDTLTSEIKPEALTNL